MIGMFLHRRETQKETEQVETPTETEKRSGEFVHAESVPGKSSEDNV
jgi:hypothetical protein